MAANISEILLKVALNTITLTPIKHFLILLSSFVYIFSRSCLSKLRNYEENDGTEDYLYYLEAMCNWGKIGDVFEMVDDWIKASMPKPLKNILASYATVTITI
jgi:hypothetical protein